MLLLRIGAPRRTRKLFPTIFHVYVCEMFQPVTVFTLPGAAAGSMAQVPADKVTFSVHWVGQIFSIFRDILSPTLYRMPTPVLPPATVLVTLPPPLAQPQTQTFSQQQHSVVSRPMAVHFRFPDKRLQIPWNCPQLNDIDAMGFFVGLYTRTTLPCDPMDGRGERVSKS